MKCKKCGEELSESMNFCSNCGSRTGNLRHAREVLELPEISLPTAHKRKAKKPPVGTLCILGMLLACAIFFVVSDGWRRWPNSQETNGESGTAAPTGGLGTESPAVEIGTEAPAGEFRAEVPADGFGTAAASESVLSPESVPSPEGLSGMAAPQEGLSGMENGKNSANVVLEDGLDGDNGRQIEENQPSPDANGTSNQNARLVGKWSTVWRASREQIWRRDYDFREDGVFFITELSYENTAYFDLPWDINNPSENGWGMPSYGPGYAEGDYTFDGETLVLQYDAEQYDYGYGLIGERRVFSVTGDLTDTIVIDGSSYVRVNANEYAHNIEEICGRLGVDYSVY